MWAAGFGGQDGDHGQSVAVDGEGNVYITGHFRARVDFGDGIRATGSLDDIFAASFDAGGGLRWAKTFGDDSCDYGSGIAVDSAANVYVTGSFRETPDFRGEALTSQGNNDVFVARLQSDGTPDWATSLGGPSSDKGGPVAIDGNELFVAGEFLGTASSGPVVLTSEGPSDIFLTRFSPDGTPGQTPARGGPASDQAHGLAVSDGGIHLTGSFGDTVDLGETDPLSASHDLDILSLQLAR